MQNDWAAQHLQVIRTLMERSALYRRALAPVMLLTGAWGTLGAIIGYAAQFGSPVAFGLFWFGVAVLAVMTAFAVARRQALRAAEPFWTPPARRVTRALAPPLIAGFALGMAWIIRTGPPPGEISTVAIGLGLPAFWMVLYGCALQSAGFFMPRGIQVFGALIMFSGCLLYAFADAKPPSSLQAHGAMGMVFGLAHLAYGAYLSLTERNDNAA